MTSLPTASTPTTCNSNQISFEPMNDFASKRERRIERFRELAEKHENISNGRHFAARQQLEMIPPGQPMLVGHHSERGHRAHLKRIDQHFAKAKPRLRRIPSFEATVIAVRFRCAVIGDPRSVVAVLFIQIVIPMRPEAHRVADKGAKQRASYTILA